MWLRATRVEHKTPTHRHQHPPGVTITISIRRTSSSCLLQPTCILVAANWTSNAHLLISQCHKRLRVAIRQHCRTSKQIDISQTTAATSYTLHPRCLSDLSPPTTDPLHSNATLPSHLAPLYNSINHRWPRSCANRLTDKPVHQPANQPTSLTDLHHHQQQQLSISNLTKQTHAVHSKYLVASFSQHRVILLSINTRLFKLSFIMMHNYR